MLPELPVGPERTLPFPVEAPGWRESTVPFCTERYGPTDGVQVWSDEAAVFAMFADKHCPLDPRGPCGSVGTSIYSNSGKGWERIADLDEDEPRERLSGLVAGPLVTTGWDCDLSFVLRSGNAACLWDGADEGVVAVSMRGIAEGAALTTNGTVLSFDSRWTELANLSPQEPEPHRWVDLFKTQLSTFAVGDERRVVKVSPEGKVEPLPDVPEGNFWRVWAFSDDDVWFSAYENRLYHFDGSNWESVPLPISGTIRGFWGSGDGTLYFITDYAFGRVVDEKAEILASDNSDGSRVNFTSLWGNFANEVFVGVQDYYTSRYRCSGAFVLFFDGEKLHRF